MTAIRNTLELVQQVRDQTDETNQKAWTNTKICGLLDYGQTVAASVLALHYPEPLLFEANPIPFVAGQADYDSPTDAFEDRIVKIVLNVGGGAAPLRLQRRDFSDVDWMALSTTSRNWPLVWCAIGRKVRFLPAPASGSFTWTYARRPRKLVLPYGRVTGVGADYVYIERLGDSEDDGAVSSETDRLASYISVINWATGEVRASFQVESITGDKVKLRATPQRSSVKGETISSATDLASSGADFDDYLCLAEGTCVPFFQDSLAIHLVAYGCARLRLALDGQAQLEAAIEAAAQTALESAYYGREATERVQAGSPVWGGGARRLRPTTA